MVTPEVFVLCRAQTSAATQLSLALHKVLYPGSADFLPESCRFVSKEMSFQPALPSTALAAKAKLDIWALSVWNSSREDRTGTTSLEVFRKKTLWTNSWGLRGQLRPISHVGAPLFSSRAATSTGCWGSGGRKGGCPTAGLRETSECQLNAPRHTPFLPLKIACSFIPFRRMRCFTSCSRLLGPLFHRMGRAALGQGWLASCHATSAQDSSEVWQDLP